MRAVVQRVSAARVEVRGEVVGRIDGGLVAFVGIAKSDAEPQASQLVEKILGLRIFEDGEGKMNLALSDVGGALLLVSQFTLLGDTRRGRRPSFERAMPAAEAEPLYLRLVELARERHPAVETGRFRADMRVLVDNEGPVTLLLDTALT